MCVVDWLVYFVLLGCGHVCVCVLVDWFSCCVAGYICVVLIGWSILFCWDAGMSVCVCLCVCVLVDWFSCSVAGYICVLLIGWSILFCWDVCVS